MFFLRWRMDGLFELVAFIYTGSRFRRIPWINGDLSIDWLIEFRGYQGLKYLAKSPGTGVPG